MEGVRAARTQTRSATAYTCMLMHRHSGCIIHKHATRMYFENIWAELSYELGPSCLINLGRVGMGRVLCGPSWHEPSWLWSKLSVIHLGIPRGGGGGSKLITFSHV